MGIKEFRGTRQYNLGLGRLLVLKYYIIEKSPSMYESYYGVEISQEKVGDNNMGKVEINSLLLSESKIEVEELINKFIGNGVTPDTMEYIVDDLMELPC